MVRLQDYQPYASRRMSPQWAWWRANFGNPAHNLFLHVVPDRARLKVVELRRRAGAGEQKATLAREFGISRETLYQYLKVAPTA